MSCRSVAGEYNGISSVARWLLEPAAESQSTDRSPLDWYTGGRSWSRLDWYRGEVLVKAE